MASKIMQKTSKQYKNRTNLTCYNEISKTKYQLLYIYAFNISHINLHAEIHMEVNCNHFTKFIMNFVQFHCCLPPQKAPAGFKTTWFSLLKWLEWLGLFSRHHHSNQTLLPWINCKKNSNYLLYPYLPYGPYRSLSYFVVYAYLEPSSLQFKINYYRTCLVKLDVYCQNNGNICFNCQIFEGFLLMNDRVLAALRGNMVVITPLVEVSLKFSRQHVFLC